MKRILTSMMVLQTSTAGGRTGGTRAASTDVGEGPAAEADVSAGRQRRVAPAPTRAEAAAEVRVPTEEGGVEGAGPQQPGAVMDDGSAPPVLEGRRPPVRTLGRDRRL